VALNKFTFSVYRSQFVGGQHFRFRLLDVIMQKQWGQLSLKSLTFSWQCTSTPVICCSASCLRLWICSPEPSRLPSTLGFHWLFPDEISEVPSLWNSVYRWWIAEDRRRGIVWDSKQKILFSGHKQLRTKVENMPWCCMGICQQEVQLSPSDSAMRPVTSNLANYHATVQKLLIRQVLTKPMVWSWKFSWRQCVINKLTITCIPTTCCGEIF